MTESPDWRDREIAALRERLSRLSQASLRINESLDFDAVLQGALDSARSLTSARYGVMILPDGGGGVQEFLTSGMTSGEAERLLLTPDRWRLFAALTNIDEPLRLPDLTAHVHALGFADFNIPLPVEVFRFMAAPMFHRGVRVGHVFVGDREGGEEFKGHYVNRSVRRSRPPSSRRISPPRFEPSRLRIHHTVHPQLVAPAIHGSPGATHSVVAMPHQTFNLAGAILIPD